MSFKILCFGDSLTAGYMSMGTKYHPYSLKLQELLNKRYPNKYEVITLGYPGATVVNDFEKRFEYYLNHTYPLVAVIILGGTNDLSYNIPPEKIALTLFKLYSMVEDNGIKIFGITIPESKGDFKKRDRLYLNNLLLLSYRTIIDLDIPYSDTSGYWDDNLHFSAHGYNKMGEIVYNSLIKYLDHKNHI
jgi:lysophospholipase L1-like esterase